MRWSWRFWQRRRREQEEDFERELRTHLDLEAEEQRESLPGLSDTEARNHALRAFGNKTWIKEEVHNMSSWTAVEQFGQDLKYAFRGARRNPGWTAVAILSLTLGIGATTTVFSLMNAVVLRPLPVANPEELVLLKPELRGSRFVLFHPVFEQLSQQQRSLSGLAAVSDEQYLKVTFEGAEPSFVKGTLVTGGYFPMLGLTPALGRLLEPADDNRSAPECAAVASHSFWTVNLRADPAAIGRKLTVKNKVCTIVGITPAKFQSHLQGYAADLWLPLQTLSDAKLLASWDMAFYSGVMGRLRPEFTAAQAQLELNSLYQGIQAEHPRPSPRPGETAPKPADFRLNVVPGAQGLDTIRMRFGQPLRIALAVVAVVLLIAAVNVANLLLARGAARSAELATRAALGAGRSRLLRLVALESVLVATIGGALGFVTAYLVTPLLARNLLFPTRPEFGLDTTPDVRVLSVALAATLAVALLAGIIPGLRLSGRELQSVMAGSGRTSSASRSSQRLNRFLVATQLALSLLLISAAGLMLRTILQIASIDPGFDVGKVVMMDVRDTTPGAGFGDEDNADTKARRAALYRDLDRRLNSIPGVAAASASWLGLFGGSYVGLNLYDVAHPEAGKFTLVDYVTPRYFDAVGMHLLRGRGITDSDTEGALRVAVVNEAFVHDRLKGEEAIGRRFVMTYGTDLRPFTIVGVVRDAKYNDLREKKKDPMMWTAVAQVPVKVTSISIRLQSGGGEASVIREARSALAATSPHLMVRRVTTLKTQVDQASGRERMLLSLAAGFGAIALALAAVGLYGMLAYAVARRTRELGIRLALGAQPQTVLRLVLGESLRLAAGGLIVGIPLSLAAGYLLRSFLFGVTPYDWLALVGSSVVLTAVALLAASIPARRASKVDPLTALKYE